jgi:hypothetical protein
MAQHDYEQTGYTSSVNGTDIVVNYNHDNALHIYVAPPYSKNSNYETYHIQLTSNTRKLPEFKRFNNDIRARIGTGIYICSKTPGFNLPLYLAQELDISPWYLQRTKVIPT